jgi:hypothetical protein
MRRATILPAAALALLATACVSDRAEAQALAQRVRAAGDGVVEMRYATRPGICGDGRRSISIGRNSHYGEWNGSDARDMRTCAPGARVRMRVEGGAVTDVRLTVGPRPTSTVATGERVTDLGEVPSAEAASYFLGLAGAGSGKGSHGAIMAAVVADSASVWRRLFAIATDTARVSSSTRRDAMLWVSRFAAAKATGHGEDIAAAEDDRDEQDDTRDAAVFALSQLRGKQGVEPLIEVARSNRDPQLRQKAIFWLGQSGDPRAVALFREILGG